MLNSEDMHGTQPQSMLYGDFDEKTQIRILSHLNEADLTFVVQAFLSLQGQQHLYIVAKAPYFVTLIGGLLNCLPSSLHKLVTFSSSILAARGEQARIIGLTPDSQHAPIDGSLLLNCSDPTQTSVLHSEAILVEYARFAIHSLTAGMQDKVRAFFDIIEKKPGISIGELLLSYKLFVAQDLSAHDILDLLQIPDLAAHWLSQAENQQIIIDLVATRNDDWWKPRGEQAFAKLFKNTRYELTKTLSVFIANLTDKAIEALLNKEIKMMIVCLNIIYITAPPENNHEPWEHILHEVPKQPPLNQALYQRCEWETYLWLLKQWARIEMLKKDKDLFAWLTLPWHMLAQFLEQDLSLDSDKPFLDWHVLAVALRIKDSSGNDLDVNYVKVLMAKHQQIFERALQFLLQSDQEANYSAVNFACVLIEQGYTQRLQLVATLLTSGKLNSGDLDTLLQHCNVQEQEKVAFIEKYGSYVLASSTLLTSEALDWVTTFITALSVERLQREEVKELITLLREQKLTDYFDRLVFDWQQVGEIIPPSSNMDRLPMPLTGLSRATERLQLQQDPIYTQHLLQRAVQSIQNQQELLDFVKNFDRLFSHPGENDFLLRKLIVVLKETDSAECTLTFDLKICYIKGVLTYALQTITETAIKELFVKEALATLLTYVERDDTFDLLDKEVQSWSEEEKVLWDLYGRTLPPKKRSLSKFLGKLLLALQTFLPIGRVPTIQPMQSDWIAKIGSQTIDLESFEKVHVLKHLYISYRLDELGRQQKTTKYKAQKEAIKDESVFLAYHGNRKYSIQATINVIINDIHTHRPKILQRQEKGIEQQFDTLIKDLKSSKAYKKISRGIFSNYLKDSTIKEVILIFLRCTYCYTHMDFDKQWHQKPVQMVGIEQNNELLTELKKRYNKQF